MINQPKKLFFNQGVTKMSERFNDLVRNQPVAEFYYRGQSHDRPVRRRVLITSQDKTHLTGYELREGNYSRNIDDAPIKTYLKSRIATCGQCRTDCKMRKVNKSKLNQTTLVRKSIGLHV